MSGLNEIILDDEYKLRVTSQRLTSGKFQVKFFATVQNDRELYGYLLVGADETLKNVIKKIRKRLEHIDLNSEHRHFHLYNIGQARQGETNFMIFQ